MSHGCSEVHTPAGNCDPIFSASFDRCTAVVSEDGKGRAKRRLAAILFAGYGRLVSGDEAESFAARRSGSSAWINRETASRKAAAQRTASTTLSKSISTVSPVHLRIFP